jgi:hypothetical protein
LTYLPQPTNPHITQIQRFPVIWQTEQVEFSDCF